MVVSDRKGKASASQSNPTDLKLVCAEPEPLKSSIEESADYPSDGEEDSGISNNESSDGDELGDEILCATTVGEGHREEQISNQVNDEEKDHAIEMNLDRADEQGSPRESVEVSEEVNGSPRQSVEEDKKVMEDGKGVQAGVETRTSEMATEGNIDNNEGLSAYDNRIMEENLGENMQTEESNKVNAVEPGNTPTNNEKSEVKVEDASAANDPKPGIQKVDRPRRKVLKKKVVKKKVVVQDNVAPVEEAKLQSSVGDEASNEVDKGTETKEEMKMSNISAEKNTVVNEGCSSASGHGVLKEELVVNIDKEEANKVTAEVMMATPADNKCAGEDAKIVNDNKSVPDGVGRPKRKVVKKKVVKKKTVQNSVTLVDETKAQSGNGDKAETKETVNNEVPGDNENSVVTGDLANNNVKAETKKTNGPKGTVSETKEPKAQISTGNNASGKGNVTDKVKDGQSAEKSEVKPVNKKRKRVRRKKVPKAPADEKKPKVTNNEAGRKDNKEADGKNAKTEEAAKPEDKESGSKKGKRQKVARDDTQKAVPSEKGESSKKVSGMGMIFMCNSETKKDCYHYKILGLPAGKKDLVLKIYKGMRLFLFDVNLRKMYGIYKAAEPGGYNIEPKAFNSEFPSQVRFTVMKDCVPLSELEFKSVIKANYYSKNKFDGELNSEQVKNLCKLFLAATRRAESIPIATPPLSRRDRKRKQIEDSHFARLNIDRKASCADDPREARRHWEARRVSPRHLSPERSSRRREGAHKEVRGHPIVIEDDRYDRHRHHHRLVAYDYERERERETYRPPPPPALPPTVYHHEPRASSYSYDYEEASRADIEVYRRDPALRADIEAYRRDPALDHHRLDLHSSRNWDRSVAVAAPSSLDLYGSYRETTRAYRETQPMYETSSRRDAVAAYESISLRPAEYRVDEYRAPLPPYRRY